MAIDDFPRGTYEARVTEFPARRTLTEIDGSGTPTTNVKTYDVALAEGTITQEGTPWSPSVMVNLENRIANSVVQIRTECNTKQNTLVEGSNITLTPQQDGTVEISATGGGGGSSTLAGLTDVALATPTDGQALIYDATSSKWVNANGGSGSATLSGLTDVTLTTPTADQVLKYDGTKWVNGEGGGDVELSKTVSGSVCSFSDGADGIPVKDLVAEIVAVQSGTGDPSPSNVRPISGRSSVGVTRAGKNIIKYPYYSPDGTYAGLSFTTGTDGKITASGTTSGTLKFLLASGIKLVAGTYTLSVKGNHTGVRLYVRNVDTSTTIDSIATGSGDAQTTFTINSNADNVDIYYNVGSGTTVDISSYVQLEFGNGTAYEPYNGTTTNVSLGQTVHGGSRNITSGELTVTHGKTTLNDLLIYRTTSYTNPVFYANLTGRLLSSTFGMSDKLKYIGIKANAQVFSGDSVDYDFAFNSRNEQIYIRADSYSDVEQLKEALGSTEIIYELAQPITVQQTGVEITAHETTNIWADTGDTTVTYYTSSAEDVIDLVQYDTTKQDKLTAGTGISIDANNVISATGGGGSTYTAGSNIKISAQNVISAIPQHNIIFGGDNVTMSETGGVPYRFSVSGIRYVASIGFIVDSTADQGDYIRYWFPVALSSWLFTHYHLYIRYQVSNYMTNNSVVADTVVEFDGQATTLTLNGAEFSVELTATDLTMSLADSPTDNVIIDSICLTIEDDEGLTWSLRDNIIQEYVQDYVHTVAAPAYTDVTGTLEAGETTLTLTNNKITTNSTIQCFYGADDVEDPSKSVSTGSITLTFSSARQTDLAVKVRVS